MNKRCAEIRARILDVMQTNGGHLASNLGSVELIVALHEVFNSPVDKLIFDTSHQIYAHKILTGRADQFHTIRKDDGLCGFSSPKESPHDLFYAGHAGTGLSLALGMAKARDLRHGNEHIVCMVSDAPFSCGLTLEALNHVPRTLSNFILLLNDNGMAISEGTGTIHNELLGQAFFQQFHFHYTGPIDGHDIDAVIQALNTAKHAPYPVVIHAKTVKGYGMHEAEQDPITYHGYKPPAPTPTTFPKIFGNHVLSLHKTHDLVTITPGMAVGSCLEEAMRLYPDRCIDVGIAEGHAVTFAGGLARDGQAVLCSIYATFFQRALDHLFQEIVLQNFPVVFALDRAGLSPADGTTHHGIFDIGFLYAMPGLVIAQPRNGDLLKDLLDSAFAWKMPTVIRYPNYKTTETRPAKLIPLGKGEILVQGRSIAIIALGHLSDLAFSVRALLQEKGINATIVDPIFLKPFDTELLHHLSLSHELFVTIEEHAVTAGLGMIVKQFGFPTLSFGLPDQFIEHGTYTVLMEKAGLSATLIAKEIYENHWSLSQPIETTSS